MNCVWQQDRGIDSTAIPRLQHPEQHTNLVRACARSTVLSRGTGRKRLFFFFPAGRMLLGSIATGISTLPRKSMSSIVLLPSERPPTSEMQGISLHCSSLFQPGAGQTCYMCCSMLLFVKPRTCSRQSSEHIPTAFRSSSALFCPPFILVQGTSLLLSLPKTLLEGNVESENTQSHYLNSDFAVESAEASAAACLAHCLWPSLTC